VLSRFAAFESGARRCPTATFVGNRRLAAAIMVLALVAAAAPPAWAAGPAPPALAAAPAPPAWAAGPAPSASAAGPQNKAPPHGKADYAVGHEPSASELNADGSMPDAVVKAGVEMRAFRAWDCDQPDRAPVVWGRADHGTISVKPITSGPHCGRPSMTAAGIFYTSEPGFKGTDKVYVLGFMTRGRIEQTATILVK
jgi:hypothetical protein